MHETHAPNEIFVLPVGANASDLKDEDAVVVEEVVNLPEETLVPANADVLREALVNHSHKKMVRIFTSAISRLTILVKEPFCGGISR